MYRCTPYYTQSEMSELPHINTEIIPRKPRNVRIALAGKRQAELSVKRKFVCDSWRLPGSDLYEARRLEFRDVEIVDDEPSGETILEIEVRGKRGFGYCKSLPNAASPFQRL